MRYLVAKVQVLCTHRLDLLLAEYLGDGVAPGGARLYTERDLEEAKESTRKKVEVLMERARKAAELRGRLAKAYEEM